LRKQELKFCTDPKKKQNEYNSEKESPPKEEFIIGRNRFFNRRQSK
jgi:hypothetical protein